jgi:hypothetical protein
MNTLEFLAQLVAFRSCIRESLGWSRSGDTDYPEYLQGKVVVGASN